MAAAEVADHLVGTRPMSASITGQTPFTGNQKFGHHRTIKILYFNARLNFFIYRLLILVISVILSQLLVLTEHYLLDYR